MRIAILAVLALLVAMTMADRLPARRCRRANCKRRFFKRNCADTCAPGAPEIPEEDQEPEDEPLDCSAAIFESTIMLGGTLTREEGHADVIDPLECQKFCEANPECEYFTIRTDPANPLFAKFPGCWLKSADTTQAPAESGTISGYKCCAPLVSLNGACVPMAEEEAA